MKRLLLFALSLCPAAHAQTPAAPPVAPRVTVTAVKAEPARVVPDEIFDAELSDLDGTSFSLSNYRGQVFVLNFWASWCGPCRLEIPELNRLNEEYAGRGVAFIGLTTERPGAVSERVREFAREFKMTYQLGWADPDVALALMSGNAIPQTLVVAPDGRVVLRIRGYSNKIPQMLRAGIEKALDPSYVEPQSAPAAQPSNAPPAPAPRVPARP